MRKIILFQTTVFSILVIIMLSLVIEKYSWALEMKDAIELPKPQYTSNTTIEEALYKRKSVRHYENEPLMLSDISQLLWAAQGITRSGRFRTAPSAGALYPLEVYLVVGSVNKIPSGIYKYNPKAHSLMKIAVGDKRVELSNAAFGQSWVKDGSIVMVFAGVFKRTERKYGDRSSRYVYMEAGSAAQNVYLQAVSLNLGTVLVGAFDDKKVKGIVQMRSEEDPLIIMPVGRTE